MMYLDVFGCIWSFGASFKISKDNSDCSVVLSLQRHDPHATLDRLPVVFAVVTAVAFVPVLLVIASLRGGHSYTTGVWIGIYSVFTDM